MSSPPPAENSLAIAMVELDRLERERKEFENQRGELRATAQRQAHDIRELDRLLRRAWPRAIARRRHQASAEHRRSHENQRRLAGELEREHAERVAALARENAERRVALARLEREVVAEFHPARAALAWLTPFAAAGLVAAFGFLMIQQQAPDPAELAQEPSVPLTAIAEPIDEVPSEAAPRIASDAIAPATDESTIVPPVLEPAPSKPSKPGKKPSASKPSKPSTPVTKPVTKPNSKPIVLGDGDDPLGDL